MIIELDNFIIFCEKKIDYMDAIIKTLEKETSEILNMFKLNKLKEKKKIIIFNDINEYKKHMEKYTTYYEWMCADINDGNINLLDLNEARKTVSHKQMSIEEFMQVIIHEFVHSCEQQYSQDHGGNNWFWEGLATNLSHQDYYDGADLSKCDFELLKKSFNEVKGAYSYAYSLGKYMLNNYSIDEIIDFIKNPNLLKNKADEIFYNAVNKNEKNN